MKTKFEIGDEVFKFNTWGKEGYEYLGIVEAVYVYKYRSNLGHRRNSDDDVIEVVYYSDKEDGSNQNSIEATEAFKTEEEAIAGTIRHMEHELAIAKEGLSEKEAKIARLKELL